MKAKLVDLTDVVSLGEIRDLTAEEEAALIAEYKSNRTPDAVEADYRDLDAQIAAGVPAEQLLKELQEELLAE